MRYVIATLGIALTVCLAALSWQRQRLHGLGEDLAHAQTQMVVASFEAAMAKADVHIVTQYVERERVIHDVIHDIQRETPRYVTAGTDLAFPLPIGFVRLHDAAAAADLPGPPGPADAQASAVKASDAALVIAENYGTCHAIRAQLDALIDRLQAPPYQETAP